MTADLSLVLTHLGYILAAAVVSLPIAWEREEAHRTAGLRTFPVVAVASCAFTLLALHAYADSDPAQARILQGIITGIGFIGGGAILSGRHRNDGGTIPGIATAASIWNTGAIGAAVGYGYFHIAVVLSVANYLILRFLKPMTGKEDEVDRARHGD